MSGLVGSSQLFFGDTGFYGHEIEQSCRFDSAGSAYLSRTPSSASNRRTYTLSCWFKPSGTTLDSPFLAARTGSGASYSIIGFSSSLNKITIQDNLTTWPTVQTSAVFRDVSSWYHLVVAIDTTQGTDTNRVKIWVNNELQTLATTNYYSQNADTSINNTIDHHIGQHTGGSYYDGYLAEYHFIDGTALTPSSFGEAKEGVWTPKAVTGLTYGTNGFYLKFDQTGTGTASASTIGADSSGNTHHFTSSGMASIDSNRTDSPTNNFATWNKSWAGAGTYGSTGTLVNGGLELSSVGSATNAFCTQTLPSSGKYYAEMRVSSLNSFSGGLMQSSPSIHRSVLFETDGTIDQDNSQVQSGLTSYTAGNTIGILADMDAGTVQFKLQNSNYGSAVTLTSVDDQGEYTFMCRANAYVELRTDSRDFAYSIPDGYSTLSTANVPEPTISPLDGEQPSDHFNTILYSGDGNSTQNITGVGFKPSWTWIKERTADGTGHVDGSALADEVRGYDKYLSSNENMAESTGVLNGNSTRSNDGFQTTGSGVTNQNSQPYVAWNWLGANGTTSNSDGSITSTVSANTTAGFSIVSYTGSGATSNQTVGVGLNWSGKEKLVIIKNRSISDHWFVNSSVLASNKLLTLDTNNNDSQENSSGYITYSSNTFTTYNGSNMLNLANNYIAYCFTDVEGYCKVGRFTGNGGTDGTYIYTGFRPAWVLIKNTADAEWWSLFDNKRLGYNEVNSILSPNDANQEYSAGGGGIDLLSNGFKLRSTSGNFNGDGDAHIFLAFAEMPFKYANAR